MLHTVNELLKIVLKESSCTLLSSWLCIVSFCCTQSLLCARTSCFIQVTCNLLCAGDQVIVLALCIICESPGFKRRLHTPI